MADTTKIELRLEPEGRKLRVIVDGEDVSQIVQAVHVDATVDGMSKVAIWALATDANGNFYKNDELDDVERRVLVFENPDLVIRGNVDSANFVKDAAKRKP